MKKIARMFLFMVALAIGGGLGIMLLTDHEPLKILLFAAACGVLGEVFYQIDRMISKK